MSYQQTLEIIKATVKSFLPESRVLLFGSRARNDADKDSDYDLLVITADTLAPDIKMQWENRIRKALVFSFKKGFDIVLMSEVEVTKKRKLRGHIVYYAMKDAIEI